MSFSPKPSGINSTPAGKAVVIERTKRYMEGAKMIIVVPFQGVTKENTDLLKKALPSGVKASMVKNALLRKCVEGTDFAPVAEDLKYENMFLFCPEGTTSATYAEFQKWQKEVKRTEPEFDAKVVVLENQKFTGEEMVEMVNLPTKNDLIARLCRALMEPATQLARVLQAVADKYGTTFDEKMPEMAELEEWLATIRGPEEEPDEEESEEGSEDGEPSAQNVSESMDDDDDGNDFPLVVEPFEKGTMGALAALVAGGGTAIEQAATPAAAAEAPSSTAA